MEEDGVVTIPEFLEEGQSEDSASAEKPEDEKKLTEDTKRELQKIANEVTFPNNQVQGPDFT